MQSDQVGSNVLPISVIIPTKNEELYLPRLLQSINNQLYRPSEVIVSDGDSTDKTREVAAKYGAKVIKGGLVSVGRNNGAKASKEDLLVFFDADVRLPKPTFLLEAYAQFLSQDLDGASGLVTFDKESHTIPEKLSIKTTCLASKVSQLSAKTASITGHFIMIKKCVFNDIGGFNKDLSYREDTDFVRRLKKDGYKFKVLNVEVETSGRRYRTPIKFSRVLLAVSLTSAVFGIVGLFLGSSTKKKILDIATKIYGDLGGEDKKQKAMQRKSLKNE